MIHRDRLSEANEAGTVAAVCGGVNLPDPSKDHAEFIANDMRGTAAGPGFRLMRE
jgi:hypothetical protein